MVRAAACVATGVEGIYSARRPSSRYDGPDLPVDVDDVWLGNGVSDDLDSDAVAARRGDEVLIRPRLPAVDGARRWRRQAVHYVCDEEQDWDLEDIRSKVTDRTKAIVIISEQHRRGVLPRGVEHRRHRARAFAAAVRRIDRILYDDAEHIATASLALTCCASRSTACRRPTASPATARRMVLTGPKRHAEASSRASICWRRRACARTCPRSTASGAGRLPVHRGSGAAAGPPRLEQRNVAWEGLNHSGVSCVADGRDVRVPEARPGVHRSTTTVVDARHPPRRRSSWSAVRAFKPADVITSV